MKINTGLFIKSQVKPSYILPFHLPLCKIYKEKNLILYYNLIKDDKTYCFVSII